MTAVSYPPRIHRQATTQGQHRAVFQTTQLAHSLRRESPVAQQKYSQLVAKIKSGISFIPARIAAPIRTQYAHAITAKDPIFVASLGAFRLLYTVNAGNIRAFAFGLVHEVFPGMKER